MDKICPPTSADKIPAEAISEVVEHAVTMLLESTQNKDIFRCNNQLGSCKNHFTAMFTLVNENLNVSLKY